MNFWLPITSPSCPPSTLIVESLSGRGDFHALLGERGGRYGEVGCFHGTACRHFAAPNFAELNRISMDFRVGVGGYYPMKKDGGADGGGDGKALRNWGKREHGRREVEL